VTDGGVPALSSSTRVVVTVQDVNDNAPEFLERFYKIQIPSTHVDDPLLPLPLPILSPLFQV
jgi:protocadherin Fat 1/2/3